MSEVIKNQKLYITADTEAGIIKELKFNSDMDGMNWLISPEVLSRYGYQNSAGCLFGKSIICMEGKDIDTGHMKPSWVDIDGSSLAFRYELDNMHICHKFVLDDEKLVWSIHVTNKSGNPVKINKMYHWLPVAYIMHENLEENFKGSCSFVPSVAGDHSRIICKKRSGSGPDLLIVNNGREMKSAGSLCKYKNLFFEKSAPSLSGLVLYNVVNAYQSVETDHEACTDWQYREMYRSIILVSGEIFEDSYTFMACQAGEEKKKMVDEGVAVVEFPSVAQCGQKVRIKVDYPSPVTEYRIFAADANGEYEESAFSNGSREGKCTDFNIGPFDRPGERKLVIKFFDGSHTFVVFAVYESMRKMVEAFCNSIFTERFIDDPESPEYCGYKSVSRQGEACAKGSVLLMKNLLTPPVPQEVRQVEKNTVNYLRKRWLHEDFTSVKQYPGGFARIIDLDYLIMQFYLLSLFDDHLLEMNRAETYLLWAYRTFAYRMEVTPDKLPREAVETELASMVSWIQLEMFDRLSQKGYQNEAEHLKSLWRKHLEIQVQKVTNSTFVETEHYFDNAGIAVVSETLLNSGKLDAGLKAVRLLLPNISDSNDYRNIAPDRWWEALAFMYHNLWAAFSAKAMLTAYEKSRENRYLFSAYKSMMPMFYNYDWNAVSALRKLNKGEGVSAFCITSPNLNLEYASRNRFGQSVFQDDFFEEMDISGDDWDLGADMIVYLSTFGQKTYVTMEKGDPICVNGDLKGNLEEMQIWSYAAYPSYYYFEPFDMSVVRGSSDFLIRKLTVRDGKCVEAGIECFRKITDTDVVIYCIRDQVMTRITPRIDLL